jgi:predicted dithiol-disulfide oxidoreductase (DUF899 family)
MTHAADFRALSALHTGEAPIWPARADEEYRTPQLALVEAETVLRAHVRAFAAQRMALPGQGLPTEGPTDPAADGPTTTVGPVDLFGDQDEQFVYHLMFHGVFKGG